MAEKMAEQMAEQALDRLDAPRLEAVAWMRAHRSAVTAVAFSSNASFLITADEDGWVVWWQTLTRRPVAIWQAHKESVLSVSVIMSDLFLVTQGRDDKLAIWRLDKEHKYNFELPKQDSIAEDYPAPWLTHTQTVNSQSFCRAAAYCLGPETLLAIPSSGDCSAEILKIGPDGTATQYMAPVDVSSDERVQLALTPDVGQVQKLGALMAISLASVEAPSGSRAILGVAFENGAVAVVDVASHKVVAYSRCHKQPVLALAFWRTGKTPAILSTSAGRSLAVFGANNAEPRQMKLSSRGTTTFEVCLGLHLAISASFDGLVRLWSSSTAMPTMLDEQRVPELCKGVNCATISATSASTAESKRRLAPVPPWFAAAGVKDGRVILYSGC